MSKHTAPQQTDLEEFTQTPTVPAFPKGWKVFPLHPGTKKPIHEGWPQVATDDPAQIAAWAEEYPNANWAVAAGPSGLCMVDVDGETGENSLFDWELEHGALPATREHRTPRGRHMIFAGDMKNSTGKIGPKLDTRGGNGYILIPPSSLPAGYDNDPTYPGGAYEVLSERPIVGIPQSFADAAGRSRDRVQAAYVTLDAPCNVARAKRYIADLIAAGDVAIQGKGGDNRTFQIAAEVQDLGLSQDKTFEVMQPWNDACQPPWPEDELRVKIENASRYSQNEVGAWAVSPTTQRLDSEALDRLIASSDSEPVRERNLVPSVDQPFGSLVGTSTAKSEPLVSITMRDIQGAPDPGPVRELIPGLIVRGVPNMLAGPGGTNKSRVGLHWGLEIDRGGKVYGRQTVQATFVSVQTEDDQPEVTRRTQKITRRLQMPDSNAIYFDRHGKNSVLVVMDDSGYEITPFALELHRALRTIIGHKFVVLDSAYNFVTFNGHSKINEDAVNAFHKILVTICIETDSTILLLWHPSQSGQERGDASGWSVAWHNAFRNKISIQKVKDTKDTYELKAEKRNYGPLGDPITLHWSDGVLLPRAETDLAEHQAAFRNSVVRVATMAAECGAPIQKQPRLERWQLDEIERDIGRRPTDREVKTELAAALPAGLLRYIGGSQHRTAGYYPHDERRAQELAHAAKHGSKGSKGGATQGGSHE
jgi:hypothetical protein